MPRPSHSALPIATSSTWYPEVMGSAGEVRGLSSELPQNDERCDDTPVEQAPEHVAGLITLRETAALLGLTAQRIYQMDDELHPVITPRGTKMKVRHYRRDTVEQVRAERSCQTTGVHSPAVQCLHRRAAKEALREGFSFDLSLDDYVDIGMMACIVCGSAPTVKVVGANGAVGGHGPSAALHEIIRVVHAQGLDRENAAPACDECVSAMGSRDVRAHIAHCRAVVAWHERLGCF